MDKECGFVSVLVEKKPMSVLVRFVLVRRNLADAKLQKVIFKLKKY